MNEGDEAQIHEEHYRRLMMVRHLARQDTTPQLIIAVAAACIDCDEPILPARLKILPSAVRCVDCQAPWELEQRG